MALFPTTTLSKCFRLCARRMATVIPKRLEGKIAVTTGSSSGIGFAISKRFAQEGAKVIISCRHQHEINEALQLAEAEGISLLGTECHVGKIEQRIRMLEMAKHGLGGIDILVMNAGICPEGFEVLDSTEMGWDKVFDTNVRSTYRFAKEAVPYMKERGKGKIIINAAWIGFLPAKVYGAYAVAERALIALTQAAALQLAEDNITVNAVAPGAIETKFAEPVTKGEQVNEFMAMIPMGRFGKPEEVAAVVAYLASDDADYVTGETICVAGGMPSRL